MINDNESINQINDKRKSQNVHFNEINKKRETLMIQKRREFLMNKKAISMRNIKEENKKINININHNININANIKQINGDKEHEDKSSHINRNIKMVKFNNSLGIDNKNYDINNS